MIASSLYEKILIREERVVVYKIRMDIAITTKLDPRGNKSGADCFSQNGKKSKYLIKSVESRYQFANFDHSCNNYDTSVLSIYQCSLKSWRNQKTKFVPFEAPPFRRGSQ